MLSPGIRAKFLKAILQELGKHDQQWQLQHAYQEAAAMTHLKTIPDVRNHRKSTKSCHEALQGLQGLSWVRPQYETLPVGQQVVLKTSHTKTPRDRDPSQAFKTGFQKTCLHCAARRAYQQLRCLDREFWFAMHPTRACLACDQLICQPGLQQGPFPAQGPDTLFANVSQPHYTNTTYKYHMQEPMVEQCIRLYSDFR